MSWKRVSWIGHIQAQTYVFGIVNKTLCAIVSSQEAVLFHVSFRIQRLDGKCGVWEMRSLTSRSLTSFLWKMRSVVQFYCYFNVVSHSCQNGVLWFPVAAWNFPGCAGHFGELRVVRWIMAFKLPEFEGVFEATHRELAPVPVVWAVRDGWDWKRGLWLGICRHSRRSGESCGEKADQFLAQRRPAAPLQGSEAPLSAKPQERGHVPESVRCATSNDARVRQKNWQVNCTTLRIFYTPHFPHSAFSIKMTSDSAFSILRIFHTRFSIKMTSDSAFSTLFIFHKNDVRLRIFHTPHFPYSAFSTLCIFHKNDVRLRIFHIPHFP